MTNWLDCKAIKRGVRLESLLRHYAAELTDVHFASLTRLALSASRTRGYSRPKGEWLRPLLLYPGPGGRRWNLKPEAG
jgi:hypothetical protein